MTPPDLANNRVFMGLNVATLAIYAALSAMFFLMPFELVDRRGLSPTDAGLVFLPFTLGVGLLSRPFGSLVDSVGARAMLIGGASAAALAFAAMAFGRDAGLLLGIIGPMLLLGVSFAILITPLTASVLSSVPRADEGLASGVNNATSRVAQMIGVAMAAGAGSLAFGYPIGLMAAAVLAIVGAITIAMTVPREAPDSNRHRRG